MRMAGHAKTTSDGATRSSREANSKRRCSSSARLWGATRETDVLARLGGDEFSLLLRPIDKPADAAAIAERIVKTMTTPFAIDGHQIVIGASVGIAIAPQDGESTDVLMKNA